MPAPYGIAAAGLGAPPQPPSLPELISATEAQHDIPPGLLHQLLVTESSLDPHALNKSSGATGIAQILPSTAKDPGYGIGPVDPNDPAASIDFAGRYLSALHAKTGSWGGALRGYGTVGAQAQNPQQAMLIALAQQADGGDQGDMRAAPMPAPAPGPMPSPAATPPDMPGDQGPPASSPGDQAAPSQLPGFGAPLDFSGLLQPPEDDAQKLLKDKARRALIIKALAAKGQHGDSMLAHLTPEEMHALQVAGGAGTTNPATGLPQFFQQPRDVARQVTPDSPDYSEVLKAGADAFTAPDPGIDEAQRDWGGPLTSPLIAGYDLAKRGLHALSAAGGETGQQIGKTFGSDALGNDASAVLSGEVPFAELIGASPHPYDVPEPPIKAPVPERVPYEPGASMYPARRPPGSPRPPGSARARRTRPSSLVNMADAGDQPPPPRGHNMPPEETPLEEATAVPEGREGSFADVSETDTPPAPAAPEASTKRGSVTDVSLRDMTHDEAVAGARAGHHLKQDPKTGQFYGAPRGITTMAQLQALRDDFDRHVENGLVGRPWYDRSQEANLEMTGDEPARSQLMAHEKALFSSQAMPDPNFGFGLKAHNAYEMGVPADIVHTGTQARKYVASRQMEERGEGLMDLGPKTKPFQEHIDPTRDNPSTSVNDIWHARAWGYKGPTGEALFSRAPTLQEHSFMDAETVLAADRANQKALGGFTDWGSGHVQASSWVGRKAEQIMTDQEAKREEALKAAGEDGEAQAAAHAKYPPISMDEALEIAKKDFSDAKDKYTGAEVYEQVPGADTGHLPSLTGADYATRKEYSEAAPWTNDKGYDPLWRSTGFYQRPVKESQGYFTPTGKTEAEANPARTARPMIDFTSTKQGLIPSDVSQGAMRGVGTLRALMDAQNMGAAHKLLFKGQPGEMGSVHIPFQRALTPEEITHLGKEVQPYGLSPSDTGTGVSLLNFGPEAGGPLPKNVPKLISGDLGAAVKRALPDAGPLQRKRQFSEPYLVDKDMNPLLAKQNEGSGIATRHMFNALDNPKVPALAARMDTPELRDQAFRLLARDEAWAVKTGDPVRADIQNMRRIISQEGLTGLRAALAAGKIALPAIAGLGIMQLLGGSGEAQAAEPGGDMPHVRDMGDAQQALKDSSRRQMITQALAARGKQGDTMLAHISPREAMALKLAGGVGTRNPSTGLPQFYPGDNSGLGRGVGGGSDDAIGGIGDTSGGLSSADLGGGIADAIGGSGIGLGPSGSSDFGGVGLSASRGSADFGGGVSRGSSFAGANLAGDPNPDAAQGNLGGQPAAVGNEEAVARAVAARKNRGILEKLGEFVTPGLTAMEPDITNPASYMHDTWHTAIDPGSIAGSIAGGAAIPGGGIPGSFVGSAIYHDLLGMKDIPTGDMGLHGAYAGGTPGLSSGGVVGPDGTGGLGLGGLAAAGGLASRGVKGGYGAATGRSYGGGGNETFDDLSALPEPAPDMGTAQRQKIGKDKKKKSGGLVPMTSAS